MTVHRDRLLMNETNRCTIILRLFISGSDSSYMFRAVFLPIIRSLLVVQLVVQFMLKYQK